MHPKAVQHPKNQPRFHSPDHPYTLCGSQSRKGRVDLGVYPGGRLARQMGAVGTGDMTVEAATVKLMYLLGTLDSPAQVREALKVPIAGEVDPLPEPVD